MSSVPKLREADQVPRLAFYMREKKCMDLSDPGTGKTPPVCVNIKRRLDQGMKTAWVQPKALMPKNKREIAKWTGIPEKHIGILDGSPAQIQKVILSDPAVMILGPDRLKKTYEDVYAWGARALDVDEFHMCFGGNTSARTTAFYEMMRYMQEAVFMTGTLINGRLDTAFPAIQAIEPRYYPFGYDQFLGAHAYLDDFGRPNSWHSHDRLREILYKHSIRFTFESIFGKQAVVTETQWLDMAPRQRKMFEKFRDEAFLELEKFFLDGSSPGTAMIRARQLMEHPNSFPDLTDPDGKSRVDILPGELPAKLEALRIHFEDHQRANTPVIVFAFFVPQQRQIVELAQSMGLTAAMMNGESTPREKNEADVGFCEGRYQVLVVSPAVGSVGFNWQFWGPDKVETDHVIFASLGFMDSDFTQGFKRTIRQNREHPLRVTTLGYYDSVDLRLMQILEGKSLDAHKVDPTREVLRFNTHGELGT